MASFSLFNTPLDMDQLLTDVEKEASFAGRFSVMKGKMKAIKAAQKRFTSSDKTAWLQSLQLILDYAPYSSIDKTTAEALSQYISFGAIHSVQSHEAEVVSLCKNLCEVSRQFSFDEDLLRFVRKFLESAHTEVSLVIYSCLNPSSLLARDYYNQVLSRAGGLELLQQYAFPQFVPIICAGFSEPGYSKNKTLLEWLMNHASNTQWGKASELAVGLWRGRYKVLDQHSLDDEFFQYFAALSSPFAREIQFFIAAISLKMDVLTEMEQQNGTIEAVWSKEYYKIVKAFVASLKGQYPDIGKQAVVSPIRNQYPAPLYAFMLVVYAAYAAKYLQMDLENLYREVVGPWRAYVDQFGIREFPYQENPDIGKYEKILYASVATFKTKNYIAPWIVELTFLKEGENAAEQKVKTFPKELQKDAQNRLNALSGISHPDLHQAPQTENDFLCQIRHAVLSREPEKLTDLSPQLEEANVHLNEQRFCALATQYFQDESQYMDSREEAIALHAKGIPFVLFLLAQKAFGNEDFHQAIGLFYQLCLRFPGPSQWQEMWAQSLATTGQIGQAIAHLTALKPILSAGAAELLAWCLFAKAVPTEAALVNIALYSGHFLDEGQKKELTEAKDLLQHSTGSLKNLLSDMAEQLNGIVRFPQYRDYPDFAQKWWLIRKASCEKDLNRMIAYLQEIQGWTESYQSEVVKTISAQRLAQLNPDTNVAPDVLETLLSNVGTSKEAFYATQFYSDLNSGLPASEIYKRYHAIYQPEHPVFKLVILYKAWELEDHKTVMDMVGQFGKKDARADILLMKLFAHVKEQQFKEAVEILLTFVKSNTKSSLRSALISWGIQLSVLSENYKLEALLKFANQGGIQIKNLRPSLIAKLLQQVMNTTESEEIDELKELLIQVLDPAYSTLLKAVEAKDAGFIDQLKDAPANGKWGAFLARKSLKALLDELKKKDPAEGRAFLQQKIPPLLQFLDKSNDELIRKEEVDALKSLERITKNHKRVGDSLAGILKIKNPEILANLSEALLEELGFPHQLNDLIQKADAYVEEKEEIVLDRLAHVIAVYGCWLEYLEQQPKIMVNQIYKPLFLQLTKFRLRMYCHKGFSEWFVNQRKQLSEPQQFLEEAKGFSNTGIYHWIGSLYLDQLMGFFVGNKIELAKLYAEQIQAVSNQEQDMASRWNIPESSFDPARGTAIQKVLGEGLDNWIKDRKGNLEGEMPPTDEQKGKYEFDYAKGLSIVDRVLEIFPEHKDLLFLGLKYANQWNRNHADLEGDDYKIKEKSKTAELILKTFEAYSNKYADKLKRISTAGVQYDFLQENQALAQHFYFKALVENQLKPFESMEEVVKWDSKHENIFWIYRNKYIELLNKGNMTPRAGLANLQKMRKLISPETEVYSVIGKDLKDIKNLL